MGWTVAVVYRYLLPDQPFRNITLYVGGIPIVANTFNAQILNTVPNVINNTSLLTYSYNDDTQIITVPDIPSPTASLRVIKPGLIVEKYASTSILINDGTVKQIQYSIFVRNTGNVAIDNIMVTDVLPGGTTYA